MSSTRVILHIDMDAFFAAIEQLDHPELRGKPVLVGGNGPRAVVSTASYEARPFGCRSAMPMAVAKRKCPQAIVVPVHGGRYREVSEQLFAIFHDFTPLVQPVSIDEAFLDLTGTQRALGEPIEVAKQIKQRIRDDLHITGSAGLSFNKFLAKLASDMDKPDGLTVITPENLDEKLLPLPVGRLWGVGPAMEAKLHKLGIHSVRDLRGWSLERLAKRFGSFGEHIYRLARGMDDRPVTPDREAKSIGHEQTFSEDVANVEAVRNVLLDHVEQVGRRLRRHGLFAKAVGVKIRFGDFQTISRSTILPTATDVTSELWHAAATLFDKWAVKSFQPVRLIGMHAEQLTTGSGEQIDLFVDPAHQQQRKLDATLDAINAKYGKRAVHRGPGKPPKPQWDSLQSGS